MGSGIFWQVIYWGPTLVLATLVWILLKRGLARTFPFFFSYIVVASAKELTVFLAYKLTSGDYQSQAYVRSYWGAHLISAAFILFATYELSLKRLFPRFYKVTFYRYLFSIAALIAIVMIIFGVYGGGSLQIVAKLIHIIDILHVVALLFFVGLMQFMGRQWARYEFAIALGLGVNAVAFVIVFVTFLKSGPVPGLMRQLPAIADAVVSLIWLITFLRPEKTTLIPVHPIEPEILRQAHKWEQTLKESLARKKPPA